MLKTTVRAFSLGMLLFFAAESPIAQAANVADFTDFSLRDTSNTIILPGRLYIPPVAISNPASPRPLILFLHGAGELGADNVAQVNTNIDNLLTAAKSRGAFLYAPQTPIGWDDNSITDDVISMISQAESTQNVDPNRIYVTGLSLGGGGTWNMLSRYPHEFAAGVPISGVDPDFDFDPATITHESVFAFHARNDVTVPVSVTRNVVDAILAAAHQPLPTFLPSAAGDYFLSNPDLSSHQALESTIGHVRGLTNYSIAGSGLDFAFYEYTTGGHGVFSAVYNTPQMYDWMFSHSLAVPEPSIATLAICALPALCRVCRARSVRRLS